MAPHNFFGDAQEMSTSESSESRAVAQPVDSTESEDEQTYGSASKSGSGSSVAGNWGTKGIDLDESLQAEVPGNENLLLMLRTAQSMRDDLEQEMKLQQSCLVSDKQNFMAQPLNVEKALGISTRLSGLMNVVEARIKDRQLQTETNLMARKEAERAAKEAQAELELLKSEHELTLQFKKFEFEYSHQELEAKLAIEKIKSAAIQQRLKEVEFQLLAKSGVNAELEAKVQDVEYKKKELKIMKSIAEKRLQGEPKRRKKAVKAALDSAEADLPRQANSFGKIYLKSALKILKLQYPNLDFSMIENGDVLGSDNLDFLDPQPSKIAPNTAKETNSDSKPKLPWV